MAGINNANNTVARTSLYRSKVEGYRHMSNTTMMSGDTLHPWELTDFNREAEEYLDTVRMAISPDLPSRVKGAFLCLPNTTERRQGIPSFHDTHADDYTQLYTANIKPTVNGQPTRLHLTDAVVFGQFFCSFAANYGRGVRSAETKQLAERYWSNIPVEELQEAEVIVHPSRAVVITEQLAMPQAAPAEL